MCIRDSRHLAQRLHHWRPNRKIGNEMPIHNVHMDDTPPAFTRGTHLLPKTGKVRRKNRRCQLNQIKALARNSVVEILTRDPSAGVPRLPAEPQMRVPHFSRPLREVGTGNYKPQPLGILTPPVTSSSSISASSLYVAPFIICATSFSARSVNFSTLWRMIGIIASMPSAMTAGNSFKTFCPVGAE